MITVYKTQSGSVYEVDHEANRIRRVERSSKSNSERVAAEWRQAERIECAGIGHPIVVFWGMGRDEHSAALGTPEHLPDDTILRATETTRVVAIGAA